MYRLLFTNWKLAALWVIGTLASLAAVFSGGEDSKMSRMLTEVTAVPPPPVPAETPLVMEDEAGEPGIGADEPATATVEEEDGVTTVTLPDGRRAKLIEAGQAEPAEPQETLVE